MSREGSAGRTLSDFESTSKSGNLGSRKIPAGVNDGSGDMFDVILYLSFIADMRFSMGISYQGSALFPNGTDCRNDMGKDLLMRLLSP